MSNISTYVVDATRYRFGIQQNLMLVAPPACPLPASVGRGVNDKRPSRPRIHHDMQPVAREDAQDSGGGPRCQPPPPPPASWPAAGAAKRGHGSSVSGSKFPQGTAQQVAAKVPSWSGFDEDFEVRLPGRGDTSFFVRVAGRELAATNGVAVVIHGVRSYAESTPKFFPEYSMCSSSCVVPTQHTPAAV